MTEIKICGCLSDSWFVIMNQRQSRTMLLLCLPVSAVTSTRTAEYHWLDRLSAGGPAFVCLCAKQTGFGSAAGWQAHKTASAGSRPWQPHWERRHPPPQQRTHSPTPLSARVTGGLPGRTPPHPGGRVVPPRCPCWRAAPGTHSSVWGLEGCGLPGQTQHMLQVKRPVPLPCHCGEKLPAWSTVQRWHPLQTETEYRREQLLYCVVWYMGCTERGEGLLLVPVEVLCVFQSGPSSVPYLFSSVVEPQLRSSASRLCRA